MYPLSSIFIGCNYSAHAPYIRKTARQIVLSRCYAANFAHVWGGGSIQATLHE